MSKAQVNKVVLAYSGGLDTSVIVPWLREHYGCQVVCYTADIGQGEELAGLEQKALASGASQAVVVDLRDVFARDYLFPMLQSGAVYERQYLMGTSIARPLIARGQVVLAEQVGADALAHGCTVKGNDQVRFELSYKSLNPGLKVIAPWREWDIRSREDALAYAELVYYGKWFTALRQAMQDFIQRTQHGVSGWVRLQLYKGGVTVLGHYSPHSLYREDFATFGHDDVYNQSDAEGFINLFGLQMKV